MILSESPRMSARRFAGQASRKAMPPLSKRERRVAELDAVFLEFGPIRASARPRRRTVIIKWIIRACSSILQRFCWQSLRRSWMAVGRVSRSISANSRSIYSVSCLQRLVGESRAVCFHTILGLHKQSSASLCSRRLSSQLDALEFASVFALPCGRRKSLGHSRLPGQSTMPP